MDIHRLLDEAFAGIEVTPEIQDLKEEMRANLAGKPLDGFPVAVSEEKFEFSIYPDGRISMTDGTATYEGQVEDWHTH